MTPEAVVGNEAAGQGRALRARLLEDDPHQCHPGGPRDPAERSRGRSWRSRIWIPPPSPRGCRSRRRSASGWSSGSSSPPSVEVSEAVVAPVLRAARVNLAEVRRVRAARSRATCPGLTATVDAEGDRASIRSARPNTIGILEGSDPVLRDEYLVFSAHMDHVGITPGLRGQHQQRRRRQRVGHHRRDRAGRGVQPAGRAAQAVDHVPDGERRGEGALGQPLLQRASDRAAASSSWPTSTST